MAFDESKAALITFFVESTLYGLFLCIYAIANVILFNGRKERRINNPMIIVTFVMLCFSTLHIGNDIQWILDGFLDPKNIALPVRYFSGLNTPHIITKFVSYCAQTLLGDAFLIYRLYAVWQNIWMTIPFIICSLTSAALVVVATNIAARSPESALVFSPPFRQYPLVFSALTLVTNAMCTILIAGKIWWIYRKTGGRDLASPMVMIVESGALYSICLVLQISLYASGSVTALLILDSLPNIIGINFSSIIVRLGLGLSAVGQTGASSGSTVNKQNSSIFEMFTPAQSDAVTESSCQLCATAQVCQCGRGIALVPLEVYITRRTRNFREVNATASSTGQSDSSVEIDDAKGLDGRV